MAGGIVVNTINTDTGLFSTNNAYLGVAKAWVNFVGNNPATINSSFNVSSITYTSTGRYVVNFTTAFSDSYYSYAGSSCPVADTTQFVQTGYQPTYGTNTASACYLAVVNSGSASNSAFVNVVFFHS